MKRHIETNQCIGWIIINNINIMLVDLQQCPVYLTAVPLQVLSAFANVRRSDY